MTHKEATAAAREMECLVCGRFSEPCHYPTHRGMGSAKAGWEMWEWVPMCRTHHDILDGRGGPRSHYMQNIARHAADDYHKQQLIIKQAKEIEHGY